MLQIWKELFRSIEYFESFQTMYLTYLYPKLILRYHTSNIVLQFSRLSFFWRSNIVKMDLVPQFWTKNSVLDLIRKKKRNSTIAFKLFLNFISIIKLFNFQAYQTKSKNNFLKYFFKCNTSKVKFKKSLNGNV